MTTPILGVVKESSKVMQLIRAGDELEARLFLTERQAKDMLDVLKNALEMKKVNGIHYQINDRHSINIWVDCFDAFQDEEQKET